MGFHQGKLGWRFPRPNDFAGNDRKPLRDTFGNLQQFMTWPHFNFTVDAQAVDGTLAQKDITAGEDPYQLIVGNVVQAPQDFDRWMFLGTVGVRHQNLAGRHILAWFHNGAQIDDWMDERHFNAGAEMRLLTTVMMPVLKGETMSVASRTPAAGLVIDGHAWGFFLPMA